MLAVLHDERYRAQARTAGASLRAAGGTAAALTLLVFVPSFVEAGGLTFAQNDFSASSRTESAEGDEADIL